MPVSTNEKEFGAQDFIAFDFGADQDDAGVAPESSTQSKASRVAKEAKDGSVSQKGKKSVKTMDALKRSERWLARAIHHGPQM